MEMNALSMPTAGTAPDEAPQEREIAELGALAHPPGRRIFIIPVALAYELPAA
jgi:hypothetical protein